MSNYLGLIKFLVISILFYTKSAYSISGSEINKYIKEWLKSEGFVANPNFSSNKKLPSCDEKLNYKKHYNNFKLIKVS